MLSDDLGEKKKSSQKDPNPWMWSPMQQKNVVLHFCHWFLLHFIKTPLGKPSGFFCIHNIIYFENKAKLSGKTTGHC